MGRGNGETCDHCGANDPQMWETKAGVFWLCAECDEEAADMIDAWL